MKKIQSLYLTLMLVLGISVSATSQVNLNLLGTLQYPGMSTAGVWHYVDTLGNEYALVGAADRVSIVDVTNPASPTEVFSVPALPNQSSLWREIKTFGKYAYAVSEGGGGVICIDLSNLPASISSNHWYGNNAIAGQLGKAHTVAATDGYLYVFGASILGSGCLIADLNDPMNPNYVGNYGLNYIHDGYIRNDTLWAGEIYAGQFSVIDVSDKTNPTLITTVQTPGQFCHNTWLSDDGTFLFTTDEKPNVPLGSFNVHDINNIELVDTYFTELMPTEEVHNVRVINDYLINPSYGSQLTICDAARPHNIIEVASFPTGAYLCWDASPYLPSGKIIATDTYGGFYVFDPNYVRGCYLEGLITDSITGNVLPQAKIEILTTSKKVQSELDGTYATGLVTAGQYDIKVSRMGYLTEIFTNINLSNGILTTINAALRPLNFTSSVTNALTGAPIAGAVMTLSNSDGSYSVTANSNGQFNAAQFNTGTYNATIASWGYTTFCDTIIIDGTSPVNIQLQPGYYDDFTTDLGWTVTSTASTGIWVRDIPVSTTYLGAQSSPGTDLSTDCNDFAFITGNGGGTATTDDVDGGNTILTSPLFDLSSYSNPYAEYSTWLYMPNNISPSSYDSMFISLSNGITTALIDTITNSLPMSTWISRSKRISDYITPSATMQLRVFIEDKAVGTNILEGGFDQFRITDIALGLTENTVYSLNVYPNPYTSMVNISTGSLTILPDAYLIVTDISGREIAREYIHQGMNQLHCAEGLKEGIYLLQLYSGNKLQASGRMIRAK